MRHKIVHHPSRPRIDNDSQRKLGGNKPIYNWRYVDSAACDSLMTNCGTSRSRLIHSACGPGWHRLQCWNRKHRFWWFYSAKTSNTFWRHRRHEMPQQTTRDDAWTAVADVKRQPFKSVDELRNLAERSTKHRKDHCRHRRSARNAWLDSPHIVHRW